MKLPPEPFTKQFCESKVPVTLPAPVPGEKRRCPWCGKPWSQHEGITVAK